MIGIIWTRCFTCCYSFDYLSNDRLTSQHLKSKIMEINDKPMLDFDDVAIFARTECAYVWEWVTTPHRWQFILHIFMNSTFFLYALWQPYLWVIQTQPVHRNTCIVSAIKACISMRAGPMSCVPTLWQYCTSRSQPLKADKSWNLFRGA